VSTHLAYALANHIKVSNNSYTGTGYQQAMYDLIQAGQLENHFCFIAAAGNDGANNDSTPRYPASYALDNVIAVASHETIQISRALQTTV